jgi:hypothetical protein
MPGRPKLSCILLFLWEIQDMKAGWAINLRPFVFMNSRSHFPYRALAIVGALFAVASFAKADVLELVNGDYYSGTVVSMSRTNIEFKSEMLGKMSLPRNKVQRITLQDPAGISGPAHPAAASGAANATVVVPGTGGTAATAESANSSSPQRDAILRQMTKQGIDSDIMDQVRESMFDKPDPKVTSKFEDMMGGYMTGKLSVNDIRAQAQDAVAQIKAMQSDGSDAAGMLDGYMTILQQFLDESAPAKPKPAPVAKSAAATNNAAIK